MRIGSAISALPPFFQLDSRLDGHREARSRLRLPPSLGSTTSSSAPLSTWSPWTDSHLGHDAVSRVARIGCSIFIASRTSSVCPASTAVSQVDAQLEHLARHAGYEAPRGSLFEAGNLEARLDHEAHVASWAVDDQAAIVRTRVTRASGSVGRRSRRRWPHTGSMRGRAQACRRPSGSVTVAQRNGSVRPRSPHSECRGRSAVRAGARYANPLAVRPSTWASARFCALDPQGAAISPRIRVELVVLSSRARGGSTRAR